MTRGATIYFSAQNCVSAGRLPAEICNFADANSAAEFEEKAPRFLSRDACERIHRACSLGFRGADGWSGRKNAIFFTPRRQGFRITVKSDRDVTVVPTNSGFVFSPRSALRRDASINPRAGRESPRAGAPGGTAQTAPFGVPTADGIKGPLPPRPPADPNFDCASVLEPDDKGDPRTGCVLAPPGRR